MGVVSSTLNTYCPKVVHNFYSTLAKKRKRSYDCYDDDEVDLEDILDKPKRTKLTSTSQYIYNTLFLESRDHDVEVEMLGKVWKLHKVYLLQSPYFASMFSGSWNESGKSQIKIDLTDQNITEDALEIVLGSLYQDRVTLKPRRCEEILATAVMFQLDELINKVSRLMITNTNALTVLSYYEVACMYGIQDLKDAAFSWLLLNLITYYSCNFDRLQKISLELMISLLTHDDLCVVQTEFSLYLLLRSWLFMQIEKDLEFQANSFDENATVHNFFRTLPNDGVAYLDTAEGKQYVELFRSIHLRDIVLHYEDIEILKEDNILPKSWFSSYFEEHWKDLLKVNQIVARVPRAPDVPEEEFNTTCLRYGRVFTYTKCCSWKWNNFDHGLHLLWTVSQDGIAVGRSYAFDNYMPYRTGYLNTFLFYKVSAYIVNQHRQLVRQVSSGYEKINLYSHMKLLEFPKAFLKLNSTLVISVKVLIKPSEPNN